MRGIVVNERHILCYYCVDQNMIPWKEKGEEGRRERGRKGERNIYISPILLFGAPRRE